MTLGQFQEIYKIHKSDIDREDKMTESVAILSGKTVREVEAMPVPEFNKLAKEVRDSLTKPVNIGKPEREILDYGICYEPAKLTRGQYVTLQHFLQGDWYENAHLILASITYNPKTGEHEADKHQEIAERLAGVEVEYILPSCVFFCQLYENSMTGLGSYLVKELRKAVRDPKDLATALSALTNALDGFTMLNRSQISRA